MKTLNNLISEFVYDLIEHNLEAISKDGKESVMFGVKPLDDGTNFISGCVINASITLYLHYKKTGNPKVEKARQYLNQNLEFAISQPCETWGKLNVLRGFSKLQDNDSLHIIDNKYIEKLKELTDYTDFFDKEAMMLINKPSNYLHVAAACAGLREKLGWENGGYSDKIFNILYDVMKTGSSDGWMDEQPNYKRYDRYSFIITSELSDTHLLLGRELPEFVKDNLALAADYCIKMANTKGDGWNYGRSLSCHGDAANSEIISSAFARGLIKNEDIAVALAYSYKIYEKVINFWYDKEKKTFDLWWRGRNTNNYRGIRRVLEVNLDMAEHLLATLHNFNVARVADTPIDESVIPSPKSWVCSSLVFNEDEDGTQQAIILRKDDTLVMLPLVGIGYMYMRSSYLPYPSICGIFEAASEAPYPFFIPEYEKDGLKYRPYIYYKDIKTCECDGAVTVTALGKLCKLGGRNSEASDIGFSATYKFCNNTIETEFTTEEDFDSAEMLVGTHDGNARVEVFGFDSSEVLLDGVDKDKFELFNLNIATDEEKKYIPYMTPHGFITEASMYKAKNPKKLSYKFTF